jgi:hypothetical protein
MAIINRRKRVENQLADLFLIRRRWLSKSVVHACCSSLAPWTLMVFVEPPQSLHPSAAAWSAQAP